MSWRRTRASSAAPSGSAAWERRCAAASRRCRQDTEAAVVILADGPDLVPEAIDRVITAWRGGAGEALATSYRGRRGHPVLLERSVWTDVPDEGARELVSAFVHLDDLGHPGDVDYPRGSQASGSLSATSFAFSSGDISSRHAVFT